MPTACYFLYQMENKDATFTINKQLGERYHAVFIRSIPIGVTLKCFQPYTDHSFANVCYMATDCGLK